MTSDVLRVVLTRLEILLAPNEAEARLRVHIALDVQLAAQNLGPTEEDTHFARPVDLAYAPEHHVPVGTAEVRWRPQTRDGIAICLRVVDHDVRCVVWFYFCGEML